MLWSFQKKSISKFQLANFHQLFSFSYLPTDPMLHSHVWTDLKNISQLIQITSEDFALTVQSLSDPGILFIC